MGKNETVKGLLFKFFERSSTQIINFIISILLARLLLPEAYGVVSLVLILITFADVFVTYGFGNSLIIKKNAQTKDYSSCLYISILVALIVYGVIFFSAPFIERFFEYEKYNFTLIIRVMALQLPFAALNSIQQAYISKHFLFNKSFVAGLISAIISGGVGIFMAYLGFGIWALVVQYMIQTVLSTMLVFFMVSWRPTFEFSFASVKESFSFGWKVLLTGLFDTLYNEIRSIVIAKKYSSASLAYYNKANSFPKLLINNINVSIIAVVFPTLAKCNNDEEKIKGLSRLSLGLCTFILCPLLIGLAAVSEAMVKVLLTDKWIECVPYIIIFSLGYMFLPINSINKNIMKAMGRSDILLKTDIIKKIIGVAIIILSVSFGVLWIAIGYALYNLLAVIINILPISRLVHYTFAEQFIDVIPNMTMSLVMGVCVYLIKYLPLPAIVCLVLQIFSGILIYIFLAFITKNKQFRFCIQYLKKQKNKKAIVGE